MKAISRICLVTRKKVNRQELLRVVRTKSGIVLVDETFKEQGRGAYISKDKSIILQAQKKKLISRALKCEVNDSIYEELLKKI